MLTRRLLDRDVDAVVLRVQRALSSDAARNPVLNATFDADAFAQALRDTREQVWVSERDGELCGHLYGAILKSDVYGHGAWTGPDGASYDDGDTLAELYAAAGTAWIDQGALEHYAWVFDDPADTNAWYELGFARMHARGVLVLDDGPTRALPPGYTLRRGVAADLDAAVELDEVLDDFQRRGPSFSRVEHGERRREELRATLDEADVHHYLVETAGVAVAQCLTFPLESRRGSFADTVHVSAVAVRPAHEHRGVGRALIDHALRDAREAGFTHAETNWRVTNHRAAHFWTRYGFSLTYVRLHRTIGSG